MTDAAIEISGRRFGQTIVAAICPTLRLGDDRALPVQICGTESQNWLERYPSPANSSLLNLAS
jgi:hypothetical protein